MGLNISGISKSNQLLSPKSNQENSKKPTLSTIQNPMQDQIINPQGAQALKSAALATLSFKGSSDSVRVPDLFDGRDKVGAKVIPPYEGSDHVASWYQLDQKRRMVTVADSNGFEVATAFKRMGDKDFQIRSMAGKSGNTMVVEIPSKNMVILMNKGSHLEGKYIDEEGKFKPDFDITMPEVPHKAVSPISFTGGLYVTTAFKPKLTRETVEEYFENESYKIEKKIADNSNFSFVMTAGGFGTRTNNITRVNDINKPAIVMPDGSKLMHNTLAKAIQAGIVDGDYIKNNLDSVKYIHEKTPRGTAGGVVDGLTSGSIPMDEPAVICSADAYSDLNYAKILEDFKKTNAGIMVVGIPVPAEKVHALGIIGMNNTKEISSFIEKPDTLAKAEAGKIKDGPHAGKYLANIATYIIAPEVLEKLVEFEDGRSSYDFGKDFLPRIQKECEKGNIKDKNGNALKMFACVADGKWNDLGTMPAYIETSRDVARGEFNLPKETVDKYNKNVDLVTGVACTPDAKEDFEAFLKERNARARGNIIVMKKYEQ